MRILLGLWFFLGWHHNSYQKLEERRQQEHERTVAFDQRAVAEHLIPPGSTAMCNAKSEIIGYWTPEGRETVYDNNRNTPIVDCR